MTQSSLVDLAATKTMTTSASQVHLPQKLMSMSLTTQQNNEALQEDMQKVMEIERAERDKERNKEKAMNA